MTLDDVRAAFEKAREWDPTSLICRKYAHGCEENGSPPCEGCLGAERAAEDVFRWAVTAVAHCSEMEVTSEDQQREDLRLAARRCAIDADRIASYFGAPGPVAAFAEAVRAFVGERGT